MICWRISTPDAIVLLEQYLVQTIYVGLVTCDPHNIVSAYVVSKTDLRRPTGIILPVCWMILNNAAIHTGPYKVLGSGHWLTSTDWQRFLSIDIVGNSQWYAVDILGKMGVSC